MSNKVLAFEIRNKTGCSLSDCKKALEICEYDFDIACAYLELKNSGVNRRKFVDGVRTSWTDVDYLNEVKKKIDKGWINSSLFCSIQL